MLTLDLVDRLLESRLVPREAKLAAIESWRSELAGMRDKPFDCRRLEQRLAAASRALAPRPWAALGYFSGALAPAPRQRPAA